MIELPSVKQRKLRLRGWVLDVVSAAAVLGITVLAGFRFWADPKVTHVNVLATLLLAGAAFLLTAAKAWRGRKAELKYEPLDEPSDIKGWAVGLHNAVCHQIGHAASDDSRLRVVVHKVVWDRRLEEPLRLEQVIRYVGGRGGPVGRSTSPRAGVCGRVVRGGDSYWAARVADHERAFIDELIEVWGFTWSEAREKAADRWSWMGVPIFDGDRVAAVVYLDLTCRRSLTRAAFGIAS